MSAADGPNEGACMCGRVRVRVNAPPIMTMACHCRGCQCLSGSAFSLTAMFSADAFEVVSGETRIGALHGDSAYVYCAHCLNWLYTAPAGAPIVNARPALFDVPAWFVPFVESYVSEKLPWAATPARYCFAQWPPPEEYGALMQAFAAER
ncbi:MAG: GFA family protein [Hyphomonadaceae bacterium]|nr:GFA family protein [Hyphomonadaceae bacterium]